MYVSTEMRRDVPETSLLRLNLRLSGTTRALPAAVLDRWAQIWHRQAISTQETQRVAGELPLMNAAVERLREGKPLAGFAVVVTGHFLTDLVHLVGCLAELGAPLEAMTVLRKDCAYLWRHRVHGHLVELGVNVCDSADPEAVARHTARARRRGLRCLGLDDGGYIAPALLDLAADAPQDTDAAGVWAGVVEQTMSGIYKLQGREQHLPFPVFSVAQSRLKGRIESYWIAEKAVATALDLLPSLKIEGQPALVIGYGNVGAQIAELLRQRRMRVAVHDADLLHLVDAHESGYITARELDTLLTRHAPDLVYAGMLTGACAVCHPDRSHGAGSCLGRHRPGAVRTPPGLLRALRSVHHLGHRRPGRRLPPMTFRPETARALDLEPHPEGGWYRRIYTSPLAVPHPAGRGQRPSGTLIHFLPAPEERSQWHTVASDEVWLWRNGGPLALYVSPPGPTPTTVTEYRLGSHRSPGTELEVCVPAGHWQSACPAGDEEVLVSCLVTPGFDFADLALLTPT